MNSFLCSQQITELALINAFVSVIIHCSRWSDPLPLFELLSFLLYLMIKIVRSFIEASWVSAQVKYKLESLYIALFGPVALCVTIIGAIWVKYTKSPKEDFPFSTLILIFVMTCVHLLISISAYERFEIWWDFYKNGPLKSVPYHPNRNFNKKINYWKMKMVK